jgi:hypothetical protein
MNPTVYTSGSLNGNNIQGLLCAIKENTGIFYGYMPQEMVDTQFVSFVLTLRGRKKISKVEIRILDATIRAWCIGYGLWNTRIVWPFAY